jgi:hypothetical protein
VHKIKYLCVFTYHCNVVNNECNAILEWYIRRFWEAVNWCYFFASNVFEQFCVLFKLFFNLVCICYMMFSSITLYSNVPDVSNWQHNCYKCFFIKFKITLHSFLFSCLFGFLIFCPWGYMIKVNRNAAWANNWISMCF